MCYEWDKSEEFLMNADNYFMYFMHYVRLLKKREKEKIAKNISELSWK